MTFARSDGLHALDALIAATAIGKRLYAGLEEPEAFPDDRRTESGCAEFLSSMSRAPGSARANWFQHRRHCGRSSSRSRSRSKACRGPITAGGELGAMHRFVVGCVLAKLAALPATCEISGAEARALTARCTIRLFAGGPVGLNLRPTDYESVSGGPILPLLPPASVESEAYGSAVSRRPRRWGESPSW